MIHACEPAPWRRAKKGTANQAHVTMLSGVDSEKTAERATEYVLAKARAVSGRLFQQGPRVPPLPCRSTAPALRFVAERRIHRLSSGAARALTAWADGFPVELLTTVPSARYVLELQARGRRCVSLLPEGTPTHPHADALSFTIHDLCHLDKFIEPEHHLGQVGFFACLDASVKQERWIAFEESFDEIFRRDWQHVAADMNGSAVFLFAALKMKLKMAVRRQVGAIQGTPPEERGPLTPVESRVYDLGLDELLQLLGLESRLADAARQTSTKRDDPRAARMLLSYFEALGRQTLYEEQGDCERSSTPACDKTRGALEARSSMR